MTALDDLTICIKAFRRPRSVERLLASIERSGLAGTRILLHDDGDRPARLPPGLRVETLTAEFNVGLSAGRNRMVEAVETSMMALLDDDFVLDTTSLQLLASLVRNGHCELAAGAIHTPEGYWQSAWLYLDRDGVVSKTHRCYDEATIECSFGRIALQYVHQVNNFFVAATAFVRSVMWDEALFVKEHNDFFLRAARIGRIGYCPAAEVTHAREEPGGYSEFRYGITEAELDHLRDKWGFTRVDKEADWFDHRPFAPVLERTEVPLVCRLPMLPYTVAGSAR